MSFDRLERAARLAPAIRMLLGDGKKQAPAGRFFPWEQIESLGAGPARVSVKPEEELEAQYELIRLAIEKHKSRGPALPAVILIEGLGAFLFARSRQAAESFADEPPAPGRLSEKIAIVTGSAQGFGLGLAGEICAEGGSVMLADLNYELAAQRAQELCERFGKSRAAAARVDVGDEESVRQLVRDTVLAFGGLDLFVSNAGILKAGSLEELDVKSFELVTKINYTAYFICVKYASEIMKIQNRFDKNYMADIVQINSKSGLAGSNKNFAYAGGKFGGIGLTQSFALELAPYNIKVNAICPGNLLSGPLWTDPEKGLFVQYLRAGKVPGAKTVEDVRRFYEAKVPMNRGCEIIDVARALLYVVEQQYETGQAVPVTGGQSMLN